MTSPQASLLSPCGLDVVLADPDFVERHQRTVRAPAADVWAAVLALTPAEVRLMGPLMTLRSIPRLLSRKGRPARPGGDATLLGAFEGGGFVRLHVDERVTRGRAAVMYGAAGRFWSLTGNSPVALADARAFAEHAGPGTAKSAFSLEVVEQDGCTLLTTETRVAGTDRASRRAFGRYWLIIRGPSGLIRRSWLAAIERRARR